MPKLDGLIPHLSVGGAKTAIDFYKRAYGAEEIARKDAQDGERLMHAHLRINGHDLFLADIFPEFGDGPGEPARVTIHLQVDDADQWWKRALEAGATATMPLDNQFWDMRYGQVRDPFGHTWSIGGPVK